ncbi:leucine--tRNA ligase [Niabella terrae]
MEYNFNEIEKKWQAYWVSHNTYKVPNPGEPGAEKPKYYVLDMFPYPSGAGLHVGHPLGYIASDIYARYKRLKGFNVLHPMGYDAFGLPAEQYAMDHGIHPAVSTDNNIRTFRQQLDNIGFCYDWSREVKTSDPDYYKWTQWIFLQLYGSWFNRQTQKATPIAELIAIFETVGNQEHPVPNAAFQRPGGGGSLFSAADWKSYEPAGQEAILMEYRLAFCGFGEVNWCEALGTVLANDEVVNGVSERGGYPVVKKKLRQWYLRITEYADRLLAGLQTVDFSEAMKEMQTNWIGKSSGAEIDFKLDAPAIDAESPVLKVYTTRPDTVMGVDFMVIAPEHELVAHITTVEQQSAVQAYLDYVNARSERERISEKRITGAFTGTYALHPFDSTKRIPVWISEYVLAGYGTGAIMAVPCGDERDLRFAREFDIEVTNIIGEHFDGQEANPTKDARLSNSGFLNDLPMREAMERVFDEIEKRGIGKRKVNYKMRDAAFSRQRYWGEPFPVKWIDGVVYPLEAGILPLELPPMEQIKPGKDGEGPLSNNEDWLNSPVFGGGRGESSTMPGYAGSSWYFLRYMDPQNKGAFASRQATDYWNQVDLYIGGTEHAVGHLLYSRMWTKVLYDLGHISFDEPFKKLVNQGMIQGSSRFVYRVNGTSRFVSRGLLDEETQYEGQLVDKIHVDVNMVDGQELDMEAFRQWRNGEFSDATFQLEDGKYICGVEVEKMSKTKYNTVNPDDLVARYGADTFRMYEMFLGPVEMSKPWDTKGIEGVHRFLKKLWRLFYKENTDGSSTRIWDEQAPVAAELKILHKGIKKLEEDTGRFSFNTGVSAFMILVNDLTDAGCHKRAILEPVLIMLAPYAPHIAEELWHQLGNTTTILDAAFPVFESKYIQESTKEYPISVNGKLRTTQVLDLSLDQTAVEAIVLQNEVVQKWLDGRPPRKIIYVKNKMINVVV